ncbi:MAG: 1-acyl-sn-glycerol-3-phosphate acyltransferase [Pyrinomonadaceae bacterium]|nr:1-acyl-sn-glycerol-3-phosphate acyltransferase [Pyrinomonadaceae bacterium]
MANVRVLRLSDMIILEKGTLARRLVHAVVSISLRLFFRRIETSREEIVPMNGPVIFVLNHPNGLIDPAFVFCSLPRRVSFLAKSTLFRIPVISSLLRTMEALPLYRRVDAGEDMTLNRRTFDACHELLRQGRCIALFPEGLSHSATQLMPIKTGAARIALGAISVRADEDKAEELNLKIVPVGLYYTSKTSFRSEALIRFGDYIEVQPVDLDEQNEPPREAVRLLSKRIETALRAVTLNVESDEALEEVLKVEQLFSSIYESINIRQSLSEELDWRRRFAEQMRARATHPEMDKLRQRLLRYEEELGELGITPESLSVTAHSRWYVFTHFLLRSVLLLMLLPLALTGALIHLPAYFFSNALAQSYDRHGVDDIVSTVKILAAIVLMPLTWLAVALLVFLLWDWRIALIAAPLTIICGYVAMRFVEEVVDMKDWYKAALALLRRRRLFLRLLLERRRLHDEIKRLGA